MLFTALPYLLCVFLLIEFFIMKHDIKKLKKLLGEKNKP